MGDVSTLGSLFPACGPSAPALTPLLGLPTLPYSTAPETKGSPTVLEDTDRQLEWVPFPRARCGVRQERCRLLPPPPSTYKPSPGKPLPDNPLERCAIPASPTSRQAAT